MQRRQYSLFAGYVNGRALLRITGEVDRSNVERLEDTLALIDDPLTVDCSRLDFLDASALQVLARDAERHGGMIVRRLPPWLCRLVHRIALDSPSCSTRQQSKATITPPMLTDCHRGVRFMWCARSCMASLAASARIVAGS